MFVFLLILSVLVRINAYETCETPQHEQGQCVLINHCPKLFTEVLQNNLTEHIKEAHCGFHSLLFPKVCCPLDSIKPHNSKNALKCGLHTPESETDPWIALIEYEKPNGKRAFLCGGVLIHKKYILTTAHCVRGRNLPSGAKPVNVRFGANSDSSHLLQIEDTVSHENYDPYDPNQINDIALVRLKKKVTFRNGAVRPICLPVDNGDKIGERLLLAGWEKAGNGTDKFLKRAGLATVWNGSECREYGTAGALGDNQMCAGGKKGPFGDRYRVDLGGVLMEVTSDTSFSVVGVLSMAPPCCDKEDKPKVYTKVSSYINWIFSNMDL